VGHIGRTGKRELHGESWSENRKTRDEMGDVDIDKRIIL
jgi:hypothetical protein